MSIEYKLCENLNNNINFTEIKARENLWSECIMNYILSTYLFYYSSKHC